jgi:hypothetical protein
LVDVALRAAQGAEILHVLRIGLGASMRSRRSERGVDHLAEAELLGEIVGPAEQRRGRHLAVDQLPPCARTGMPSAKRARSAAGRYCSSAWIVRVVAPDWADRDRHALQVLRLRIGDSGGTKTPLGATE